MSVVPSGFYEASVEIAIPGDAGPAFVVFGGDFGASVNAQAIADACATVLSNASGFRGAIPSTDTLSLVKVRANYGGPDLFLGETAISLAGGNTAAAPPPNVATLVQKLTGLAGRRNRGRMYLPAVNEGLINTGGDYTGAEPGNLQAQMNTFLSGLAAADLTMHILHSSAAFVPTEVDSLNVTQKVATQRRRLR